MAIIVRAGAGEACCIMGWIHMGDLWQERGGRTVNREGREPWGPGTACAPRPAPGMGQVRRRRLEGLGARMRVKGRSLGEGGASQCCSDLEETIFKSHVKQPGQPAALLLFSTSSGLLGREGRESGGGRARASLGAGRGNWRPRGHAAVKGAFPSQASRSRPIPPGQKPPRWSSSYTLA